MLVLTKRLESGLKATAIVVALASFPVLVQLGANGRTIVVRDGDRSLELTGTNAETTARRSRRSSGERSSSGLALVVEPGGCVIW